MKTKLKDPVELKQLLDATIGDGNKDLEHQRELIEYIDKLHERIRTLESNMEAINIFSNK